MILYFTDLMMPAVERDFWHARGYEIYYESTPPDGPMYDVVPIDRILGACPLIRLYRNVTGTIPIWAEGQQKQAYPKGRRDTETVLGSKTYVLNNLALKFSR